MGDVRKRRRVTSGEVKNRKLLRMVKEQDEICPYCKGRMKTKSEKFYDGRLASIEHIYSKLDIRRFLSAKTIATCIDCNNKKAASDEKEILKRYPPIGFKHYKDLIKKILNNEETTQWFKN